jgi:hypothetical protein
MALPPTPALRADPPHEGEGNPTESFGSCLSLPLGGRVASAASRVGVR